ncbi:HNH endonuclease signature motif containing protein [Mycobacterium sp. THU-M104]|uniref:HNH endonuclease signature motif containing protein n=1 Tax=Mycobacterium sp. THU-M104 TaxID=3410515 RepID=UPI003B9CFA94
MSVDREELGAAFDALDADLDTLLRFDCEALSTPELLAWLGRVEKVRRRLPALEHAVINTLAHQASAEELGGKLSHAIAEATSISRPQAARRVREAADLGERHGLTGQPLPPVLAETALRQRQGTLGPEHVAVIRRFCRQLPGWVDQPTRERAEADLARHGTRIRPEQLSGLAEQLDNALNPDGNYTDEDRARRRGLILGAQGPDKMSHLSGWITPELRATLEALWAKLAAPGMCNPLDEHPCIDGTPTQDAIDKDARGPAQRQHDGLLAALRAILASGKLGQHNGLPAAIIATTTLAELEAAAGCALTGGGTILPMSDVIRLARHAHHYLAIFDKGKTLALYHTKRLASPAQRIVLYAKDRGCSAPGCTVGGYYSEVHHVTDWATCRCTDIDDLTFACGPHHRLLQPRGWTTRKNTNGDTEWIPPPHLDRGQPRKNTYWHPEKLLRRKEDEADENAEDES